MTGWHEGPMLAFDLETTGVDVETARIVTACVALIDGTGKQQPKARTWLVDPGVDIPEGATKIHGISTEQARANGRPAAECVREIFAGLMHKTAPIVAFNASYDLTVLDREMRRYGIAPLVPVTQYVVDPYVLDKYLDKFRPGSRKLVDQCRHYEVRLDGAHDASFDAVAAARVAWRIAQKYPHIAAMDLHDLHELQVAAKAKQDAGYAEYLRKQARKAKTADEQTDLWARAESCTGAWPLVPLPVGASS